MRAYLNIAVVLAAACGDGAPENPTWADVQPILMANCARCHGGASPIGGAPTLFRLDVPFELFNLEGDRTYGAASMANFIVARACDEKDMPPIGPELSDRQCQIIEGWAARNPAVSCIDDTVGVCSRLPDSEPTPALLEPTGALTADTNIRLVVFIDDADRDQVTGILRWSADNDAGIITDRLHGGRNEVVWDTRAVPEGTWSVTAQLGDSINPISGDFLDYDLGAVTVTHASGNVAPRASFSQTIDAGAGGLAQPIADQIVSDADSPFEIRFAVSDPDVADVLTYSVVAVSQGRRVEIVADAPVVPAVPLQTVSWDTTSTPAGTDWRIEVTVDDGTTTTTWRSREFIVSHGASSVLCADVQPVFDRNCINCHGEAENYRVPNGPIFISNLNCGVGSNAIGLRGLIYRLVFQKREMPPRSAGVIADQAEMTQADRDLLEEWLLGGTPIL